jgi:cytidylate kinase
MSESTRMCIAFAGVVGSSKSQIAYYLSCNAGLPIISNDAIRAEVAADLGRVDVDEYIKRRDERGKLLIRSGKSFIYDASIDREWSRLKSWLSEGGYAHFIISLDLSKDFLTRLYGATGYNGSETMSRIDKLMGDHERFLETYGTDVGIHIKDEDFPDRLGKSLTAVEEWV